MASWNLLSLSCPENCLEQLEMGFPRGAQPAPLLCSVLKASGSLQQLSLDSATFASPQDFGLVLQTLKGKTQNGKGKRVGGNLALFFVKAHGLCPHPEYNLALKRLSFHDMNLADCQSEVLFLLQNLTLQGKFSSRTWDIPEPSLWLSLSH